MTFTGHRAGLEEEEWKVLGGRRKVNVHYRLMLISAHNTVFDFEYQQSASLNSGLYTMMLTHFVLPNQLIDNCQGYRGRFHPDSSFNLKKK